MRKSRWPLWRDSWRRSTEQLLGGKYGVTPTSLVRHGEPWKLAEDRRLLRLVDDNNETGLKLWVVIASALGRTTCAVQARFHALRAGERLARRRR